MSKGRTSVYLSTLILLCFYIALLEVYPFCPKIADRIKFKTNCSCQTGTGSKGHLFDVNIPTAHRNLIRLLAGLGLA